MTRLSIIDRLQAGDVLVMDGATGSELQRRGVDVNKGSVEGKLGVWSAAANLDAPEVVRAIHEDYLDADLYVARVERRGVAINGADWFYIGDGTRPEAVRICLGNVANHDHLREALETFDRLIDQPNSPLTHAAI